MVEDYISADEALATILLDLELFPDERNALRVLPVEHGPTFLPKLRQDELGTHLQIYA